jgi:CHAD domain-containing protein
MAMGMEREAKLTAPASLVLPDLTAVLPGLVAAPAAHQRLDAVYYDCADLRLARDGVTLRYRRGDEEQRWTLKLPAGRSGHALVRRELEFDGSGQRVPPRARDLVHGYLRSGELRSVARLHTDRTVVELRGRSGAVAKIADDRVSGSSASPGTREFREVEVELCEGDTAPAVLRAVVERLLGAGCRADEPVPKLVRVLGDAARAAPDLQPPEIGAEPSMNELVRHALATSATRMVRHDAGVRLGDDPEDVHQFRVATRRLRSDLRTVTPVLDPGWVRSLREPLRWLAGEVGPVRDNDVLTERLHAQASTLPDADNRGADLLLGRLAEQGELARARMLAALRAPRYSSLLDALVAATWELRWRATRPGIAAEPARSLLAEVVHRQWRRLRRAVDALGAQPSDTDLHRVRILAKRSRYAVEAAIPALDHHARDRAIRLAAALADVQTVLGEHHDALIAEQWLRSAAEEIPDCALAAGQLIALQRIDNDRLRRQWPAAWHTASAKQLRSWL